VTPLPILLRGFGLSAGLIVAIGAQNAFVLRQGLRRQHVWLTALICIACDILMFSIGGAGFGSLVAAIPALTTITAWGGAIFILVYGALAFRSALRPSALEVQRNGEEVRSRRAVILTALGVSLLNPHAWLDTVVLVGGIAGQYAWGERVFFLAGAMLASTVWFHTLAFGARVLAPIFARPAAWRVLDAIIGAVMWLIAFSLLRGVL
jgi:L-lysine exporter family protein LysE/ArgO